MWWIALLCLLLALLIGIFCWLQNNLLQVTFFRVEKGLTHPIRLVHLSDLHGKSFGKNNRRLLRTLKRLSPDAILFTGDLVHNEKDDLSRFTDLLGQMQKQAPVFYVLGNHEHRFHLEQQVTEQLRRQGVTVLIDELAPIQLQGNMVHLLGLDENQGSHDAYRQMRQGAYEYRDSGALFHQLEQKEGLRLVLSHYPENFALIGEKSYQQYQFDVMFSGHAHGGQFIFPLIGGIYSPGQGLRPKYYAGLYGSGPRLVVSRGLGNSSFPLRLFNLPNIVCVDID